MKEHKASRTAVAVAIMRALEARREPSSRICFDPLARFLVDPFTLLWGTFLLKIGVYHIFARGGYEYIVGRERYVDDFLSRQLQAGATQVVILGAGLDSRPYRLEALKQCTVFEVDHPSTQAYKIASLKKAIDSLPANVVLVAVDFETQSLPERLFAAAYDPQAVTVFVWQGVSMYLTAPGVDNTLAFIAGQSAAGSTVIFDYCYASSLGENARGQLARVRKLTGWMGEKMTFGINPEDLQAFLASRGFENIESADNTVLKNLYFDRLGRGAPGGGIAIASARVK